MTRKTPGSERHSSSNALVDPVSSAAIESVMGRHRSKRQSCSPGSRGEDPKPEGLSVR